MKKIRLTALVMIFVFAFTLMGCAAGNDAEKEELEAKVEQLEQQVTDLQRSSGQEAPSPEEEATLPDNVREDDNKEKSSSQAAASSTGDTLDTLETAVNDAVKEAEAAKPSGSSALGTHKYKCAFSPAISETGSALISVIVMVS